MSIHYAGSVDGVNFRIVAFLAVALLRAQAQEPFHLAFTCTEEDTREAGLTCAEDEPCPVYLELSGVEAFLNRIFVVGNLHTSEATLYSILLASDDNGKTWTEPVERIRFASLEQIQFIDFQNGFIGGAHLQGVPRDPFFLITHDGGKTWQRRPVFEDSHFGVIEKFWFDSLTNGTLLIDTKQQHELFITETGGSSWSLEQSGKQVIRFPHPSRAPDQSVRLRPEAKTHGYRLEKRQGDKWSGIGDFPVDAGKCRN
jgi:photosystem II stability/assembly factor-like uncharacterized protein